MSNELKEMIFYLYLIATAVLCVRDLITRLKIQRLQNEIDELKARTKEKTEALMRRVRKISEIYQDSEPDDETEPEEFCAPKYDEGICKNCVYKDCFDCRVHYYQEDMLEKFEHEGWDRNLLLQYDNRKDMANAAGECRFYCEDASKIVTCTECKHCILGEKGTMSAMTGECLKERCGTYDECSWCPYGERKEE